MEMYNQGFSEYSAGLPRHFLRGFHDAFSSHPGENLSVLDFGSGPSVLGGISAAPKAKEIILSDYTESNRQAARDWLDGKDSAFDWTGYFRYVVQEIEGKGAEEVSAREGLVRKVVKDVVPCDVNADPPVPAEYDRQYDAVICCLVLACATQSREDYEAAVNRLAKLVAPGGLFLFFGVERSKDVGFYILGDKKFKSIGVTSEFVVKSMEKAGLSVSVVNKIPASNKDEGVVAYMFIKATKL